MLDVIFAPFRFLGHLFQVLLGLVAVGIGCVGYLAVWALASALGIFLILKALSIVFGVHVVAGV